MAPARVFDPDEVQVNINYQFDVYSQVFTSIYRAGEAGVAELRREDDGPIEEETFRKGLDAALMWKLFPLGGGPEVIGRLGLTDKYMEGIDAGLRFNGNVVKADVRLQMWESYDEAMAFTMQAAVGRHSSVVSSLVEYVTLTEWSRYDFDLQLPLGYSIPEIFDIYVAPRGIVSRIATRAKIPAWMRERLPEDIKEYDPAQFFETSYMYYVGGTTGFLLGYRYVFVNLEMSILRVLYRPVVLESRRDYNGWVVSPTAGLSVIW